MGWYFRSAGKEKKKDCQSRILFFENEGEIKIFPGEQKLIEFISSTSSKRNTRGSPSGWNEMSLDSNQIYTKN